MADRSDSGRTAAVIEEQQATHDWPLVPLEALREALNQGQPCARTELAKRFWAGRGVARDQQQAIMLYQEAAEQGEVHAQIEVGLRLRLGEGLPRDPLEAMKWLLRAACQIDVPAGTFEIPETRALVRLFPKPSTLAQTTLADMFINGEGVAKNRVEAHKWLEIAASDPNSGAKEKLAWITPFLSESELTDSKRRVTNFLCKRLRVDPRLLGSKSFVVFDLETDGLPRARNAPHTDLENWPRIVALGWKVFDNFARPCEKHYSIVRPDGFVIPQEASAIHGITTEVALSQGLPLRETLRHFLSVLASTAEPVLVAHNMNFERPILAAEIKRTGMDEGFFLRLPTFCTMLGGINYCKLPKPPHVRGPYAFKYPALEELHTILFDEAFENPHTASADVDACARCFFELVSRGIVNVVPKHTTATHLRQSVHG